MMPASSRVVRSISLSHWSLREGRVITRIFSNPKISFLIRERPMAWTVFPRPISSPMSTPVLNVPKRMPFSWKAIEGAGQGDFRQGTALHFFQLEDLLPVIHPLEQVFPDPDPAVAVEPEHQPHDKGKIRRRYTGPLVIEIFAQYGHKVRHIRLQAGGHGALGTGFGNPSKYRQRAGFLWQSGV